MDLLVNGLRHFNRQGVHKISRGTPRVRVKGFTRSCGASMHTVERGSDYIYCGNGVDVASARYSFDTVNNCETT